MSKRPFHFIYNPNAGKGKTQIKEHLKRFKAEHPECVIKETFYKGHGAELTAEVLKIGGVPVAVGGDGTVNEVAEVVCGSGREMGIIPGGSGNGFARHLNIPLNTRLALDMLNSGNTVTADTCRAGNHFFIMLAGVGFDAQVAEKMAGTAERGLSAYTQIVLRLWRKRKPVKVKLHFNNRVIEREVFMCTAANSSQFGNNVFIAPGASVTDGLLDIVLIKRFDLLSLPSLVKSVFLGGGLKHKYVEHVSCSEFTLKSESTLMNIDGESVRVKMPIDIKVLPASLKVICRK